MGGHVDGPVRHHVPADHPRHLLPPGNYWMKLYYTDRRVLFAMCAGNELFYAMLYLSYFTTGPLYMFYILAVICFPVAVLKTGIACLQGYLAAVNLVGIDTREREEVKKE